MIVFTLFPVESAKIFELTLFTRKNCAGASASSSTLLKSQFSVSTEMPDSAELRGLSEFFFITFLPKVMYYNFRIY